MDEKMIAGLMRTNWIWTPEWTKQDDEEPEIVLFRKKFVVADREMPELKRIRISADSRYKLYVNGRFVQDGPQKAVNLKEWFVDEADICPYLQAGWNVIAIEVLRYPASSPNDSLYRTEIPNLYVEDMGESKIVLEGKSGWKCSINREVQIVGEAVMPAPIHVQEMVSAKAGYAGWMRPDFNDSEWADAVSINYFDISRADAPGCLVPRTIPNMRYEEKNFEQVVCLRDPEQDEAENSVLRIMTADAVSGEWNAMLKGSSTVTIPAHTKQIVEISAEAEENGYLIYAFAGGKGTKVATLCSECYAYPPEPSDSGNPFEIRMPVKGDRTDFRNGKLFGNTSVYTVAGYGTEALPEEYEPFWFRTFRFLQLCIITDDEPLTICGFHYRACGYPLDVKTHVEVSDPYMSSIWEISERTLRRCMQETYFDCPFYEQLQYAMDSRSEILYTYAVSADDRLARQAMEAFRMSQRPDGMINSGAPTVKSNPIVSFSIYYILMIHDHMMYFGDEALVRKFMPSVDSVLNFFDSHLSPAGLVEHVGGPIMREKYWSFIDWSPKWGESGGVPGAINQNTRSLTAESLLYVYGLQKASELAEYIGRHASAEEYRNRAAKVSEAVRNECFGVYRDREGLKHRLLQDGSGVEEYSVHAQVLGILTGVVEPEEGKDMLHTTVGNPDLAQASVSFMLYLFRAMELTGCYEDTDEQWNKWREMVDHHLTTCVENDTDARSDCHAWASLALYEIPCVVLGVRPAKPGFAQVHIAPQMGKFSYASGDVITTRGMVHVEWKREGQSCALKYTVPEGMEVV